MNIPNQNEAKETEHYDSLFERISETENLPFISQDVEIEFLSSEIEDTNSGTQIEGIIAKLGFEKIDQDLELDWDEKQNHSCFDKQDIRNES